MHIVVDLEDIEIDVMAKGRNQQNSAMGSARCAYATTKTIQASSHKQERADRQPEIIPSGHKDIRVVVEKSAVIRTRTLAHIEPEQPWPGHHHNDLGQRQKIVA